MRIIFQTGHDPRRRILNFTGKLRSLWSRREKPVQRRKFVVSRNRSHGCVLRQIADPRRAKQRRRGTLRGPGRRRSMDA